MPFVTGFTNRQSRDLERHVAELTAENDYLRRRVEALERERAWEAGWITAKCEEMRALMRVWR